jgi:hypothetical protein
VPTNNCAANQISTGCTRGVDCAWWVNTLKAETCVTGTVVRADVKLCWRRPVYIYLCVVELGWRFV